MDKLQYMVVGRLESEKWIPLILHMIDRIAADESLCQSTEIHIFGDGQLRGAIQKADAQYDFVHYYGHQPKETVLETRKQCHFTLMLSNLLETFGLVALDSLSVGVPVIGYKKGGVIPFIDTDLDVLTAMWETRFDQLRQVFLYSRTLVGTPKRQEKSQWCLATYKQYTKELRMDHFRRYVWPDAKKILLVSDYTVDIGGIENFLLSLIPVLEDAWYEVRLIGSAEKRLGRRRYLYLAITLCNRKFWKRVQRVLKNFTPDLIRRHSVHRRIGRYPLRVARTASVPQWVMYHDFGLFHPFPSSVHTVEQVEQSNSLNGYFRQARKKQRYLFPLLFAKWCSARLISRLLKKTMSRHLVPSVYMEPLVRNRYRDDAFPVETFPHFVK